jgi:hypothetical protein
VFTPVGAVGDDDIAVRDEVIGRDASLAPSELPCVSLWSFRVIRNKAVQPAERSGLTAALPPTEISSKRAQTNEAPSLCSECEWKQRFGQQMAYLATAVVLYGLFTAW